MKGITIPCPYCKEILLRHAVVKGEATFETLCPHCKELVTVCCGHEPWITASKAKASVIILIVASLCQIVSTLKLQSTITAITDTYEIQISDEQEENHPYEEEATTTQDKRLPLRLD